MYMLKQVAETLPEINENELPDYDNNPGFLKWLNENTEEKRLAEKKELSKRKYNGTWLEASQED